MPAIKTAKGTQLLVLIGEGDTVPGPETFAHPCSINAERDFSREANVNETVVPDCDDPDAPGWVEREVESLSAGITGSGVLNTTDLAAWDDWFENATAKNCKVKVNVSAVNGGRTYSGAFLLTSFSITGERGDKVQVSVTLQSTGPVTSADNAA